ncbi:hypothetical protein PYCCODRAFT_1222227 [Trametes coccinea BRFM310]|uniref:Uncharacterized protein n=1 Tax=Trametes coccinea (strain BRFM310) TaxID=1353009 RepID=A0A1Y2IYJ5_TRAC3|nr:hypothetical protein PYCCODRAFT_1222227 [Trametes coccinea BRFM310]
MALCAQTAVCRELAHLDQVGWDRIAQGDEWGLRQSDVGASEKQPQCIALRRATNDSTSRTQERGMGQVKQTCCSRDSAQQRVAVIRAAPDRGVYNRRLHSRATRWVDNLCSTLQEYMSACCGDEMDGIGRLEDGRCAEMNTEVPRASSEDVEDAWMYVRHRASPSSALWQMSP